MESDLVRYFKVPLELTAAEWTEVKAPIDCDFFWIRSRDPDKVILESMTNRDPGDPAYDDDVPSGMLQYLPAPAGSPRFPAGKSITWLRAQTAPCTAVLTFIL